VALLLLAAVAGYADEPGSQPVGDQTRNDGSSGFDGEQHPEHGDLQTTYNSHFRLAGTALKPRDSDALYQPTGGGGCFYAEAGTYNVYNAPLSLPQGSTLKYFRMYFNDTSAAIDSTAWLTVYDLYGAVVQEWSVNSSGSSGNGYATTSELTHVVDYWNYSYMINWRPYVTGSQMQVCGFRLYYFVP
jgi:hypothetical protein